MTTMTTQERSAMLQSLIDGYRASIATVTEHLARAHRKGVLRGLQTLIDGYQASAHVLHGHQWCLMLEDHSMHLAVRPGDRQTIGLSSADGLTVWSRSDALALALKWNTKMRSTPGGDSMRVELRHDTEAYAARLEHLQRGLDVLLRETDGENPWYDTCADVHGVGAAG